MSDQVRRLEAELNSHLLVSTGRGVALTSEGKTFYAHAQRVLAGVEAAAASVGSGSNASTFTLGLMRNAPYYPLLKLAELLLAEEPELILSLPGQNSSLVAGEVRAGTLEAAIVILPIDPKGLEIRPLFKDEVLFVSADPSRVTRPARVEDLTLAPLILYDSTAGFGDPTRRQLAARAQAAGLTLTPKLDVEHPETALHFASQGLGDTVAAKALTQMPSFPRNLGYIRFADPLFDQFALVTRAGVVSTSVQRRIALIERWAQAFQGASTGLTARAS